jgi:hypothetical protein
MRSRLVICAMLASAFASCERSPTKDQVVPRATPGCTATRLEPSYLPAGVKEVERDAVTGKPEWWRSWSGEGKFVQAAGGISADFGDDPTVTYPKVRGQSAALGSTDNDTTVVTWHEKNECGSHQYEVATRGLAKDETLKVANGLKKPESSSSNY